MKKLLMICISIVLMVSCQYSSSTQKYGNQSVNVTKYNDTIKITPSPKEKMKLPEGMSYGLIENRTAKDKIESNLLRQIASYNKALLLGDKDNCVAYLYKDAVTYLKKYYSFTEDEVIEEIFKRISSETRETLQKWNDYGIDIKIVVPSFARKIVWGNKIYIVFNVTSVIYSETVYTYVRKLEENLAISEDGGKKWTFLAMNDDTPNILRLHIPEKIIDEIMGY